MIRTLLMAAALMYSAQSYRQVDTVPEQDDSLGGSPPFVGLGEINSETQREPTAEAQNPEAKLLNWIHSVNLSKIMSGQLAERRSRTPAIRNYGRLLVENHADLEADVRNAARRLGIELSGTLAAPQQIGVFGLRMTGDDDFDRAFSRLEAVGYPTTMADLEATQVSATDSEVKELTERTLAKLHEEVGLAEHLTVDVAKATLIEDR